MSPFSIASPADIGQDRTLLFRIDRSLTFVARPRLRFALNWLRETAPGQFGDPLCRHAGAGLDAPVHVTLSGALRAAVAVDEEGRLRLRLSMGSASSLLVEACPGPPPAVEPLVAAILALDPEAPPDDAARLASAICAQALRALEKQCAAELGWRSARRNALLDRSFDFTPKGLAAYRAALEGSLAAAHLARALGGERTIETQLPFLERTQWPKRWALLAGAETVTEEDGRVVAHAAPAANRERRKNACQNALALAGPLLFSQSPPDFTLGFTDARTGPAAVLSHSLPTLLRAYDFGPEPAEWLSAAAPGDVRARFSLSLDGARAGAWLRAPEEKDSTFFEVYSKMSVAVQRALRRWLPYVYLSRLDRFENTAAGYPLIFYGGTYPHSGRPRSEFTHDLVTPEDHGVARPWAWRPLASSLARTERLLIAAGRRDLAHLYEPWRAREVLDGLVAHPRFINSLLSTDAFFVDRLVGLGLAGRELSARFAGSPFRATRDLSGIAARLTSALNHKLWRLYRAQEFMNLGGLLLVEATGALCAALDGDAAIRATLRLSSGNREQTFVNAAFRP